MARADPLRTPRKNRLSLAEIWPGSGLIGVLIIILSPELLPFIIKGGLPRLVLTLKSLVVKPLKLVLTLKLLIVRPLKLVFVKRVLIFILPVFKLLIIIRSSNLINYLK